MTASWEYVAHLLEKEPASDAEMCVRLGCPREFVARVRSNLKMPAFAGTLPATASAAGPPPYITAKSREQAKFDELSVVVDDGHRDWRGRCTQGDETPLFDARTTAARVSFRLYWGRDPVGIVRVECEHRHCVEGLHLSDRLMRERAREAM